MGGRGLAYIGSIEGLVSVIMKVISSQGIAQVPGPGRGHSTSDAKGQGGILNMRLYMRVIVGFAVIGLPHDARHGKEVCAIVDGETFRLCAPVAGIGIGI